MSKPALLFDIDGTLLHAKGLGRPAFAEAFKVAYGVAADFDAVSFVGATDTAVIRAMATHHGLVSTPAKEEHFFIELTKALDPRLAKGPLLIYPGVRVLLPRLVEEGFLLGIVTGNIRETAWSKLIHAGLAPYFTFGAYATDSDDRNVIAAIASKRAKALGATARVLLGDTPKDIEAAHAIGLPCVSVATGWITGPELQAAGADYLLESFGDVESAVRLLKEICA